MDNSNSVRRGNAGRNSSLAAEADQRCSPPLLTLPREANPGAGDDQCAPAPLRVAIMDSDSGFLAVLSNRLERLGWEHELLAFTASAEKIAALELDVLILDLASLGAGRWDWLQRLCEASPSFGIVICSGASTVQERVRALRLGADDGLGKPCHAEELIARVESVAGARREPEPRNLDPVTIGEVEIQP